MQGSAPRLIPRLLMAPAIATLFLWMIVPLVMTVWFSLIRYNLMQPDVSGFAGLDNFEFFVTDPSFGTAVVNTLLLIGSVTGAQLGTRISRKMRPEYLRIILAFIVLVVAMLIAEHSTADVLVLATTGVLIAAASIPLARHLWRNPAHAPNHLPHHSGAEAMAALTADRFATRWGGDYSEREDNP